MIRRLYDWTLALAARPDALWLLAFIAFIESSFFPIPPDVLIVPMVLLAPKQVWRIASIATIASVLGGFVGYTIGLLFFDSVGQHLFNFYGYMTEFKKFQSLYLEYGPWIVFGAGLTPFPFKVITIASGVVAMDPLMFGISAAISRGLRFYIEAALLWKFGPPIRNFIEQRLGKVIAIVVLIFIGGFAAVKWIG